MDITKAILTFVLQSEDYPTTAINRKLHNKYRNYITDNYKECKTSIGLSSRGNTRYDITYIAFLNHGQTVKLGIYPVILYFRKIKKIIFAYGVSATKTSNIEWDWNKIGINKPMTLSELFHNEGWRNYDKYFDSFVHSYYDLENFVNEFRDIDWTNITNGPMFNFEQDVNELISHFNIMFDNFNHEGITTKQHNESRVEMTPSTPSTPFSINSIIEHINETGLLYSPSLIKRFAFSLMAKRFLILSGLAGSGKTQLALAFAKALVEDKEKQMCVVSVGADWTNREPLLGYPNALKPGEYIKPENGVLDLLIEANKPQNASKPFFLILDEMNMSYVERYFADFLSAMESHEAIALWKECNNGSENCECDVPERICLPDNLFIIGTINVDETTYMFSPKVLDRANVIEFKISIDKMTEFLDGIRQVDCSSICSKAAEMGTDFVKLANCKDFENEQATTDTLKAFFTELKSVNAEFGYRSATEIFRFISQAHNNDDTAEKMSKEEVLDAAILQKLLPKLHGSRKKLEPALKGLWKLCFDASIKDTMQISRENIEKAIYKESADKIFRMYESAYANGFTSFAEA